MVKYRFIIEVECREVEGFGIRHTCKDIANIMEKIRLIFNNNIMFQEHIRLKKIKPLETKLDQFF